MIEYPPRAPDSTGVSVYFRAAEASTGTNPGDPVTVTSATPGLSLSYRRQGAAAAPITPLSDLTALTDPHLAGGLLAVGAGIHRLDVPNAAFSTGSDDVLVFGSATDIVIFGALVPLGVPAGSLDANAFTSSALAAIQNEVGSALTTYGAATSAGLAVIEAKTDNLPSAIVRNQAYNNFPFYMVQASDGRSPATGLTVTASRRIDGGAFAACANSPAEVGNGVYDINLAASDLNGQKITFRFTASGAIDRLVTVHTKPS